MRNIHVYTPEDIASFYDDSFHEILSLVDFKDNIQWARTEKIEDLHEYIIHSAGIKDGYRVLDAGCGIGGPSIHFASKLDIKIEAINISKNQIKLFKKKILEKKLTDKINIMEGDFNRLENYYMPASFDIILFLESFGYSGQPVKLLQSAWNVLKPGGTLYIKDPLIVETDNIENKRRIQKAVINANRIWKYHFLTKKTIYRYLTDQGFDFLWCKMPDLKSDGFKLANQVDKLMKNDYHDGKEPIDFVTFYEIKCIKPLI